MTENAAITVDNISRAEGISLQPCYTLIKYFVIRFSNGFYGLPLPSIFFFFPPNFFSSWPSSFLILCSWRSFCHSACWRRCPVLHVGSIAITTADQIMISLWKTYHYLSVLWTERALVFPKPSPLFSCPLNLTVCEKDIQA